MFGAELEIGLTCLLSWFGVGCLALVPTPHLQKHEVKLEEHQRAVASVQRSGIAPAYKEQLDR